jgi:CRISPR system Cascade subunit CasD
MSVLLLRLAGPMQSWGVQSRFGIRDTGLEPSKSGVFGLLCAAIGRPRHAPLADLAGLAMGVRVDREGSVARDYHTAQQVRRADPKKGTQDTVLSERFYLADADFLVGLEGPHALLAGLHEALAAPAWPLYLGRKAFVPGVPVVLPDGLRDGQPLRDALKTYPWSPRPRERPPESLRLVLDAPPGQGEPRPDVPLSFSPRRYTVRHVVTEFLPTAPLLPAPEAACSSASSS